MSNKAKLIKNNVYGVHPQFEGNDFVRLKFEKAAFWSDSEYDVVFTDLDGNVLFKAQADKTEPADAFTKIGYELKKEEK